MLLTAAMVDGLCYIESAEQGIRLCQLDVGFRRRILGRTDVSLTETLVVETHDQRVAELFQQIIDRVVNVRKDVPRRPLSYDGEMTWLIVCNDRTSRFVGSSAMWRRSALAELCMEISQRPFVETDAVNEK
jgi:hypothetical protein